MLGEATPCVHAGADTQNNDIWASGVSLGASSAIRSAAANAMLLATARASAAMLCARWRSTRQDFLLSPFSFLAIELAFSAVLRPCA